MNPPSQPRRQFLKGLGIATGGVLLGRVSPSWAQGAAEIRVPRRKFGRHDFEVSSLALGGHTLATASNEKESQRIVDEAIAAGLDFMDNSWDYHDGRGEEVMGRCLKGKRDKVFLMTKVCTHGKGGKKEALAMLDQSLQRLQTDHLDLWQLHALATMDQVKQAFEPGGPLEALEEAKKQGKVRYIGFTGHTDPEVHLAMLAKQFPFDSCQFPLSVVDGTMDAFQRKVLPEVLKQNIAVLGMKSLLGNARVIKDGVMSVPEALSYALSLPVATVVSGINSVEQLRENMKIAASFTPFAKEEMLALEQRVGPASEGKGYDMYRKWLSYRDGDSLYYTYV
jgi:aryl-alcohol dehydrogenase-like predicted oxidoreductase